MSALVKIVARRALKAVEEARTRGGMRVGMPQACVDAGDLEILAKWAEASVAAPPEDGRPTVAELALVLSEVAAYLPTFAAECLNSGRHRGYEELTNLHVRVAALLSRIPKEEP